MKVAIQKTGGFAGIEVNGSLDSSDLPESLVVKLRRLAEQTQAAKDESAPDPEARDMQAYRLTIYDDDRISTFMAHDAGSNPELVTLCNELLREVMKQRGGR